MRERHEEGKREEAEERDARVLLEVVAGGARSRGAGWVRCRDEEKVVACCNWVAAEIKGAGRSDLVGWMGTLRWVAAGSGGIPRKGVAAAG